MAFISGPNPWKTLANLAASPTPFPLPGQERHRKTTVRASQRVASHQTRIFCFGKILSFSEVSWGCWRTFWTELWICFSQHLHMSKRLHVDTCLMFERPHRSRIRFRVCPSSLFFLTKTPFKSWFALFRRVILSATKILHAFPQPRHALSCVHQVMETSKELIGWSIRKMKGRKLVNKNLVVPSACFWHLW